MELLKHRDHWKRLAKIRIDDAGVLYEHNRYDAAYYLAGYAVECALTARIIRRLEGYFPPKQNLYTHDLGKLHEAAGLQALFEKRATKDKSFRASWRTLKDWSEESRYDTHDRRAAKEMLESASEVVRCLKKYC